MAWISQLPACPCSIAKQRCILRNVPGTAMGYPDTVTEFDDFDHDVWYRSGSFWWVQTFYFDYHPGAVYELRTKNPEKYGGSGEQCNYDAKGNLITNGPGAGTADKSGPGVNHKQEDVYPFDWAYELDGNQYVGKYTNMYREVRPSNNKNNCTKNP